MSENNTTQTVKLIRWLSENAAVKHVLCDNCGELSGKECIPVIEKLRERSFYDMIYILLMNNQQDIAIEAAVTKTITDIICGEWERIGNEKMYEIIKTNLTEELSRLAVNGQRSEN